MSDKSEGKEFAGFSIPEKNYFPMPNNWTNICAEIDNLSELKVIQYVIRHTWGYQEYGGYKTISVDEFMHGRRRQDRTRMDNGTGLSEPSVKDGLKRAIRHGYLVCITDDKDKGRTKKSYGLKMYEASHERGKNLTPQESYPVSNLPPEVKNLTPRGKESYPRTEKDTIERYLEKNKESVSATHEASHDADTHTSFSNSSSSSSEQSVAEQSATTPQARSADSATSAPNTSRTPTSPSVSPTGVRDVFPPDTNVVDSPPAENKSQVNRDRILHQKWAKAYLKDGTTKELLLKALALREQWLAEYGTYGDTKWGDEALIWLAEQENATWENVQKVYQLVPGETVTPEHVKNNWHRLNGKKKASSRDASSSSIPGYTDYTHIKPNKPFRPMPRAERNAPPPQKESLS